MRQTRDATPADVEDGDVAAGLEDAGDLAERLLTLLRLVDVVEREARDDDVERRVAERDLPRIPVADVDAAQMLYGVALARAGNKAEAGKAFDAIKDPKFAEIGKLYKLAAR